MSPGVASGGTRSTGLEPGRKLSNQSRRSRAAEQLATLVSSAARTNSAGFSTLFANWNRRLDWTTHENNYHRNTRLRSYGLSGNSVTKVMIVVGARPNFMKAAPLIFAIREHNQKVAALSADPHQPEAGTIQGVLVHTGQHYDESMSGSFFVDLELPKPDIIWGSVPARTRCKQRKLCASSRKFCCEKARSVTRCWRCKFHGGLRPGGRQDFPTTRAGRGL